MGSRVLTGLLTLLILAACQPDSSEGSASTPDTLTDPQLRETIDRLQRGELPPAGVVVENDSVLVQVILTDRVEEASRAVRECGGEVTGESEAGVLEALVPVDCLLELEQSQFVERLLPMPPLDFAQ